MQPSCVSSGSSLEKFSSCGFSSSPFFRMMPEPLWPAPAARRQAWKAVPGPATTEVEPSSAQFEIDPAGRGQFARAEVAREEFAADPAGQEPASSKPQKEKGEVRAASLPIVNTSRVRRLLCKWLVSLKPGQLRGPQFRLPKPLRGPVRAPPAAGEK